MADYLELTPRIEDHLRGTLEAYGIPGERLGFYKTAEELDAIAAQIGVANPQYAEKTRGVSIQVDDVPGGPDVRIFLQAPMPVDVHRESFERLVGRGESGIAVSLGDTGRSEFLLTFVVLHEIAHHQLKHGDSSKDRELEDKQEAEADLWAVGRVRDHCRS